MEKDNTAIFDFRRFLSGILLPLLLIVVLAGLIFNYYFEKNIILKSPISGAYKVNRIIAETHPDEIPIFGSSRAVMGLIPDSLGYDFFNYGMNGTYYNVTLFFLEEECKKKKSRPWIILNLDPFGLQNGIGDITAYLYNAGDPKVKSLLDTNSKPYFSVPFIKYFGHFENYYRLFLSDRIELTKVTNKGATLEKNSLTKQEFDKMVARRDDGMNAFLVDTVLKARLFSIIAGHPDRFFIFVIAPYHSASSFVDNRKDIGPLIKEITAFKNVKLFDFGTAPFPDSLFFNTSHINYRGAVLYSRMLRDSLASLGVH